MYDYLLRSIENLSAYCFDLERQTSNLTNEKEDLEDKVHRLSMEINNRKESPLNHGFDTVADNILRGIYVPNSGFMKLTKLRAVILHHSLTGSGLEEAKEAIEGAEHRFEYPVQWDKG